MSEQTKKRDPLAILAEEARRANYQLNRVNVAMLVEVVADYRDLHDDYVTETRLRELMRRHDEHAGGFYPPSPDRLVSMRGNVLRQIRNLLNAVEARNSGATPA